MRERRDVVTLVVVLALFAAVAVLLRPAADAAVDDPRISTFRSGPNGARALLLLMDELGIPREQLLRPWSDEDDPDGALVVLGPAEAPTDAEVAELLEWVRRGGTLIHGARSAGDPVQRALGLVPRQHIGQADGAAGFPVEPGHAWLEGIDSVPGFRTAFADTAPALRGDALPLLRTRGGRIVVVEVTAGEGRAVLFSDAAVLSNAAVREPGAALLFARVAESSTAPGGAVRFDEYHHGFREGGPARALWRFLTATGPGRGVLQVLVAALALLLLVSRRFGAPLPERIGRRRSPLEHVEAVAAAYRGAGARSTARRLLLAGLERRLGRRMFDGGVLATGGLAASAAGQRLAEEWERGGLTELAGAVDDYVAEVRRWK